MAEQAASEATKEVQQELKSENDAKTTQQPDEYVKNSDGSITVKKPAIDQAKAEKDKALEDAKRSMRKANLKVAILPVRASQRLRNPANQNQSPNQKYRSQNPPSQPNLSRYRRKRISQLVERPMIKGKFIFQGLAGQLLHREEVKK